MSQKPQIIRDLTGGSVIRTMVVFAAPLLLSSLLQTVYALTDMVVIGHFTGKDGLGAVSIGADILHVLCFVSIGIANAGQVVVSQLVGAQEKARLNRTIGTLFTLLFLGALIFGALCLVWLDELLGWVNTPPESWAHARSYVGVCAAGLIFISGYNCVSAVLRGMGDSRHPLYFVAVATAINVALDLLLVIKYDLGVLGVAVATVSSQAVSFGLAAWFLYRRRESFGFDFRLRSFLPDWASAAPLFKLGVPMIIQSAAISFSMLVVNSSINGYGVVVAAMNGIGNKLSMIVNITNFALATAGSSMIGQCVGAGKFERVPQVVRVSLAINGAISATMGAIVLLFPLAVFGCFTHDADVLELSKSYVPVALVLFAGAAMRPPMFSLINGTGNYNLNLCVAILDGVIARVGLGFWLGWGLGYEFYGFWYGNAIAGTIPFFIGGIYFLSGTWRTQKYILGKS